MRWCLLLLLAGCGTDSEPVTRQPKSVEFTGVIRPHHYNTREDRALGHHFITWKGGRAAGKALIVADSSDREILRSLIAAGAEAGNNLPMESWTERNRSEVRAPDFRVQGTRVNIFVSWAGKERPAHEMFRDVTPEEMEIRVGGHEALIPVWKSG